MPLSCLSSLTLVRSFIHSFIRVLSQRREGEGTHVSPGGGGDSDRQSEIVARSLHLFVWREEGEDGSVRSKQLSALTPWSVFSPPLLASMFPSLSL
mmetsp:Transcript_13250/g.26138  ORF Transcript_13250/g.26138 Transcript_13250/m.26138 type:complete len:96 (+) Transcript_13250:74-361(+)